jgi:hypothetical protein
LNHIFEQLSLHRRELERAQDFFTIFSRPFLKKFSCISPSSAPRANSIRTFF